MNRSTYIKGTYKETDLKWIVLGSGTSHGIPVIGCSCPVCRSRDSKNKRYRSSCYVKGKEGERIVIDTCPEFRLQCLRARIKRLDALLITHSHADHLHGLDDLRPLTYNNPLPLYTNSIALREIEERFNYIWKNTQKGGGKPRIIAQLATKEFSVGNLKITPLPVMHGSLEITAWLIKEGDKSAAYITDCSFIPDSTVTKLDTISFLIIDGLRIGKHPTHFSFEEALQCAQSIPSPNLKKVFLTHISHETSHNSIIKYCKDWCKKNNYDHIKIYPAFDGLEIDIN
ncbi:MAG: MBL fold metallo-hydrolase [Termitinemataceae bacterium]|nr:MAG: MBL fold metallo-hydrolase [Termitinemataceae bacterium]